jgi:outer membrane lipoprotein carrier protein
MKAMRTFSIIILAVALTAGWSTSRATQEAFGQESATRGSDPSPVFLNRVLDGLENRYLISGFSAKFVQVSSIKSMDISDTAQGRMWVKPPGQMRWEYETPDPQLIISDGKGLWVYRPEDNQVMIGKSPTFFGDGKGAGFLSDIKQLRKKFEISLEKQEYPNAWLLKLIPQKNMMDLAVVYLLIQKQDFHVTRIITRNVYGDETALDLHDIQFNPKLPNALFTFIIPEKADVLRLDE